MKGAQASASEILVWNTSSKERAGAYTNGEKEQYRFTFSMLMGNSGTPYILHINKSHLTTKNPMKIINNHKFMIIIYLICLRMKVVFGHFEGGFVSLKYF